MIGLEVSDCVLKRRDRKADIRASLRCRWYTTNTNEKMSKQAIYFLVKRNKQIVWLSFKQSLNSHGNIYANIFLFTRHVMFD